MTAPKTPPSAIANLGEPGSAERQSALVVALYAAREALSEAERTVDEDAPQAIESLAAAHGHVAGARGLLDEELAAAQTPLPRLRKLLDRAYHRIEAAAGHARLIEHYEHGETEFEQEQERRTRAHARRSSEEAKREAHRALAEACERFPNAYPRAEP